MKEGEKLRAVAEGTERPSSVEGFSREKKSWTSSPQNYSPEKKKRRGGRRREMRARGVQPSRTD